MLEQVGPSADTLWCHQHSLVHRMMFLDVPDSVGSPDSVVVSLESTLPLGTERKAEFGTMLSGSQACSWLLRGKTKHKQRNKQTKSFRQAASAPSSLLFVLHSDRLLLGPGCVQNTIQMKWKYWMDFCFLNKMPLKICLCIIMNVTTFHLNLGLPKIDAEPTATSAMKEIKQIVFYF